MNRRWKLSRHRRTVYGDVVQDFKGPEWYTNLETAKSDAVRDAKEIHGESVGDPKWVERESDPATLVWEIDSDHWYTLTERAEELEG